MKTLTLLLLLVSASSSAEIASSRLDPSTLAANRIQAAAAVGAVVGLVSVESTLMSVLVSCALPIDASVVVDGLEFFGELGLAPAWSRRALRTPERRLVTACLLARLSGRAVAVPVSLRGPRLVTPPDELAEWTIDEGAFLGDLASGPLFSCRGVDGGEAQDRTCADDAASCGLTSLGACADACEVIDGRYSSCRTPLGVMHLVVTSHLHP